MVDDPIQYVPRSLRDDGMVPLSEVAHYTHIQFVPYVTLADHEAALANERMPPDGYSLVETAAYNGSRDR